jgi:hypothetical protein
MTLPNLASPVLQATSLGRPRNLHFPSIPPAVKTTTQFISPISSAASIATAVDPSPSFSWIYLIDPRNHVQERPPSVQPDRGRNLCFRQSRCRTFFPPTLTALNAISIDPPSIQNTLAGWGRVNNQHLLLWELHFQASPSCHVVLSRLSVNLTDLFLLHQGRTAAPAAFNAASKQVRSYASEAKASPTEVSSILEQRIRGVQEESGLAETGRVLSVGYVLRHNTMRPPATTTDARGLTAQD